MHRIQAQMSAPDVVEQASGSRHDNVGRGFEAVDLRLHAMAAVACRSFVFGSSKRAQHLKNLKNKLAGRRYDQSRHSPALFAKRAKHRYGKGQSLAAAGGSKQQQARRKLDFRHRLLHIVKRTDIQPG